MGVKHGVFSPFRSDLSFQSMLPWFFVFRILLPSFHPSHNSNCSASCLRLRASFTFNNSWISMSSNVFSISKPAICGWTLLPTLSNTLTLIERQLFKLQLTAVARLDYHAWTKKPRKLHAIVIKHVISLIFVNAICIFALHGNDLLGIQEVWIITLLCKKSKNFTPALTLQNSPFQAHSIKFQQYRVLRDLKPIIHWKECFSLLFKCVFVSILHWKRRRKWSRHAC